MDSPACTPVRQRINGNCRNSSASARKGSGAGRAYRRCEPMHEPQILEESNQNFNRKKFNEGAHLTQISARRLEDNQPGLRILDVPVSQATTQMRQKPQSGHCALGFPRMQSGMWKTSTDSRHLKGNDELCARQHRNGSGREGEQGEKAGWIHVPLTASSSPSSRDT